MSEKTANNALQLRPLSSLAKVFPKKILGKTTRRFEAAAGQEISFQIAFRIPAAIKFSPSDMNVRVSSPIGEVKLFEVGEVPVTLAAYPERNDENYISLDPGVFPDVLFPLGNGGRVAATPVLWKSIWISIKLPKNCHGGIHEVNVSFYNNEGIIASDTVKIIVHKSALPEQELIFTQWFYCDCIADVHGAKIFSEKHWNLIEAYMKLAAEHGMNMILTPILTPPLDTEIGAERPTVQLVDITKEGQKYSFDFSRLERYVYMAQSLGIKYFEINHFFTQWGAKATPKVVATVENGTKSRIFGWHTSSHSEEYSCFLSQLIPAVIAKFEAMGVPKDCLYFHVSDEPKPEQIEDYRAAKNILAPLIKDCKCIDALSSIDFYNNGLVEIPIPATNHAEPFLEAEISERWCYYCCSQCVDVSNRFIAMPSSRTRIIGVQMFKYNMKGFLHWGYNFYYTRLSQKLINPYHVTDSGRAFPAGDAFSVYPSREGAIPSLRQKVFANALEDMRLLALVEEKIGHEATVKLIEDVAGMEITFSQYPINEDFFARLYNKIFSILED